MVGGKPEYERNTDVPDGERRGGERHEALPLSLLKSQELSASCAPVRNKMTPRIAGGKILNMTALPGSGPSLLESVLKRRLNSQTLCVLPSAVSTEFGV